MKRDKKSLVAYAAGYFDGEGCISIKGGAKRPPKWWSIVATVCCRQSRESIDLLKGLFGGNIRYYYQTRDQKAFYVWDLQNTEKIKKFLKTVYPFLKIKKEQAETAIRYCDRVAVGIKKRKSKSFKHWKLTDHEMSKRLELLNQVKVCNHKIPDEIVRAETERANISKDMKRQSNPLRN